MFKRSSIYNFNNLNLEFSLYVLSRRGYNIVRHLKYQQVLGCSVTPDLGMNATSIQKRMHMRWLSCCSFFGGKGRDLIVSYDDAGPRAAGIVDFWRRLGASERSFLGLDYDGTLAPFRVDPMKARPLPGIKDLLKDLVGSGRTDLAVVSGRPVSEVAALLDGVALTIVGSHGFEVAGPDGEVVAVHPDPDQSEGLGAALRITLPAGADARLEVKIASVALHTRGMPLNLAMRLEERVFQEWRRLEYSCRLECRRFNGGVELRAVGRNKGDALRELLSGQPADSFCVYVGDDETDEDAFRTIADRGIGIKVGDFQAGTAASGYLPDCAAVKTFLEKWLSVVAGERRPQDG
jgi:trehalose-phosphatase